MRAVNLIPADARKTGPGIQSGGLGPGFAVLGLLGVALVLVTIYVLSSNTISDRTVKLAALRTEVTQEQALATQLTPFATYTQLAQARAATVTQIANSRFDWYSALADLSRVMPANASLTSLVATAAPGSSISGGGAAGASTGSTGSLRGAISAPAFQLSGCTASHDDVARLMSRLRLINGVQRVTLSDSVKPATPSAAPTTTGSGATATTPCAGLPTNFDLVVFFEPLPGALVASPGSTTSGAAPAATSTVPAQPGSAGASTTTTTAATK